MSARTSPPAPPDRRAPDVVTIGLTVVVHAVLGAPAYFLAFLFAYGFRDVIGLAEHVTLMVLVALYATVAGVLGAVVAAAVQGWRAWPRRLGCALCSSLALGCVVVALGSVVSATHKAEGSVSADFSTTTDVLVAGVLLALAAVLGRAALTTGVSRRGRSPRWSRRR